MIFQSKIIWIVLALTLVSQGFTQEQPLTQTVPPSQPAAQNTQSIAEPLPNPTQSMPDQPANPSQPQNEQQPVVIQSSQTTQTQQAGPDSIQQGQPSDLNAEQQQEFNRRQQAEARMAYERVKREQEERENRQRGEMERLMHQTKFNKTQEVRNREKTKFIQGATKLKREYGDIPRNFYMFDVEVNTFVDFHIVLPHAQEVAFYSVIYATTDGIIKRASLLDENNPMQVFIYENNARLVYNKDYYFVDLVRFPGQANSTYTIKFITKGEPRLVELTVMSIVEQNHIANTISSDDFIGYGTRVKTFYNEMAERGQEVHQKHTIFGANRVKLNDGIKTYYIYTIVEMVVVAALCLMQVQIVRKLLSRSSIV